MGGLWQPMSVIFEVHGSTERAPVPHMEAATLARYACSMWPASGWPLDSSPLSACRSYDPYRNGQASSPAGLRWAAFEPGAQDRPHAGAPEREGGAGADGRGQHQLLWETADQKQEPPE